MLQPLGDPGNGQGSPHPWGGGGWSQPSGRSGAGQAFGPRGGERVIVELRTLCLCEKDLKVLS
eukprot:984563-Amphidinium_carterae.1